MTFYDNAGRPHATMPISADSGLPLYRAAPSEIVPDALRAIGALMRTQDNECTANPIFVIEQERIVTGIDTDYEPEIVWCIEDSTIFKGDEEFAELETGYDEDGTVPENYTRTGYVSTWEFVTVFFTRAAAERFVEQYGHKYSGKLRMSVETEYRNKELTLVRDWLETIATPAQPIALSPPLTLKELCAEFWACGEINSAYTITADDCRTLYAAMTTPPEAAQPIAPAADVSAPTDELIDNACYGFSRSDYPSQLLYDRAIVRAVFAAARAAAPVSGQGASEQHPLDAFLTEHEKGLHQVIENLQAKLIGMQKSRHQWKLIAEAEAKARIIDSRPRSEDSRAKALLEYFNASTAFANTVGHESATTADEHKAEARFDAAGDAVRRALASSAAPSSGESADTAYQPVGKFLYDGCAYEATSSDDPRGVNLYRLAAQTGESLPVQGVPEGHMLVGPGTVTAGSGSFDGFTKGQISAAQRLSSLLVQDAPTGASK